MAIKPLEATFVELSSNYFFNRVNTCD